MEGSAESVVRVHGEYRGAELCGYCRLDHAVSYGIMALSLHVRIYDALINRGTLLRRLSEYCWLRCAGWRRSGSFLYKPVMHKTCCPQYTIRLNVRTFAISKGQKLVRRRFERYLSTGSILAPTDATETADQPSSASTAAAHSFAIETVKPECTDEVFALYKRYQVAVHGDDPAELTEEAFTRFLCETPLFTDATDEASAFGTYHQLYRIDGALVAVSVVDVLPSGLSSVYLFYDPAHRQLVLGKVSALQDIAFCLERGLAYYYMGFYIHSCAKMRYKAEFSPSELLCPTTLEFYPLASATALISRHKFTPLDPVLASARANLAATSEPAPSSSTEEKTDASDSSLEQFAPAMKARPALSTFRLDIGLDHLVSVDDLNERGRFIVEPLLRGFVDQTGDATKDVVIKLC